jgi:hypothetical protein
MTLDHPAVVLALNSGSSSLKFGLYRVDSSHLEALVSGEADFTGDGKGQFRADDAQGAHLVREAASLTDQRDAIVRIGRLLADTGIVWCMADRSFADIAGSMTRCCGNSRPRRPSRRSIFRLP